MCLYVCMYVCISDSLQLELAFKQALSFLDCIYFKSKLHTYIRKFSDNVSAVHNNKLNRLLIQQPNFRFIDNVIFNFSSYNLSKKEKILLSLGLDFCLPCFKPNFSQFFLPFEQLAQCIKPLKD